MKYPPQCRANCGTANVHERHNAMPGRRSAVPRTNLQLRPGLWLARKYVAGDAEANVLSNTASWVAYSQAPCCAAKTPGTQCIRFHRTGLVGLEHGTPCWWPVECHGADHPNTPAWHSQTRECACCVESRTSSEKIRESASGALQCVWYHCTPYTCRAQGPRRMAERRGGTLSREGLSSLIIPWPNTPASEMLRGRRPELLGRGTSALARRSLARLCSVSQTPCTHGAADPRAFLLHRPSCAPPAPAAWSPSFSLLQHLDRSPAPAVEDATASMDIIMPGGLSGALPHSQSRHSTCPHLRRRTVQG